MRRLTVFMLALLAVPAQGQLVCGEQQVNAYVTSIQSTPAIAADPAGGFVITWASTGSYGTDTSDRSIQARVYNAAAQAEGPEFQVNTYTPGRQRRPAVAVDPGSGSFLVVWESTGSPGTDTSLQSIQARLFDASGAPFAGQMQVNSHTSLRQYNPRVAADGSGGFVVVWESETSPGADQSSYGILGRAVSALGVPLGSDFQVNAYTTSYQVEPSIMADPTGGFVVLWVSNGSPGTDTDSTSVLGRRLLANGTPSGAEFQVNTYTTSYQDQPDAEPYPGGGFVVVWRSDGSPGNDRDYGSVQGRRFDAAGGGLTAQFQVNTYTRDYQGYPDVEADGVGGFVVTWDSLGTVGTDTDGYSVQGRRYDATLAVPGAQFQVNTFTVNDQEQPRLTSDGLGGLFVAWQSGVGSGTDGADAVELGRLHDASCTTTSTSTSTSTSSSTSTSLPGATTTTSTSATTSSTTSTSTSSSSSTSVPGTSTTTSTSLPGTSTSTSTSLPGTSTTTSTSLPGSTTTTTIPGSTSTSVTTSTVSTTSTIAGSSTVTSTSTSSTTTTTIEPTTSLSTRTLRVVEARGRRKGSATVLSRDPAVGTDVALDAPLADGGALRVVAPGGSFDEAVALPATGWKRTKRGLKYKGAEGARVVLVAGKKLKIVFRGPTFPLGEASPAPIVVTLRLGGRRFCLEAADGTLNVKRGKFVAKDTASPAVCDEGGAS